MKTFKGELWALDDEIHQLGNTLVPDGGTDARLWEVLLAWLIKPESRRVLITQIKKADGLIPYSPRAINNTFREHYETLYEHLVNQELDSMNSFLQMLLLREFPQESHDSLGGPVTLEKMRLAIKDMAAGKFLGPDGLPAVIWEKRSNT
ncbi:hypothetical protein NDU88_007196 [Pleurodeles waltl]|uniref:Uncharacterized protein n=1 Tax=Pleurodeles waltl TaxID=8319 RepID=A0AAV7RTD3_PLEWA|nr:hypothetical protein NDU88_007196 [Pleurodeles waltl]